MTRDGRWQPWLVPVMTVLMGCQTGMASSGNNLLEAPPTVATPGQERPVVEEDSLPTPDLNSSPDIYLDLIARLQGKNLYFASLAHLDAFDHRWPNNPRATLMRANALRETGYPDRAVALYESLLQTPFAASAQHGLGLIASKRGNLDGALQALSRASQLDPTNASVLNDLGYIQILARRMEDAGFNLHKAVELDPNNARAGANLALYYLLDNKPERAKGIMDWYRLTDKQRKEIYDKAAAFGKPIPPISVIN